MTEERQFSVKYGFVRTRQLEDTLHKPAAIGVWPISSLRVHKGWGFLRYSDWPDAQPGRQIWPPLEPPGLDEKAKAYRTAFYQRCATLAACRVALSRGILVQAAFEITNDWTSPPGGVIPLPRARDTIAASHAVTLMSYDDERRLFRFHNSWPKWGDNGYGYLPYQYLDKRLIDAFVTWYRRPPIDMSRLQGMFGLFWIAHSLVGNEVLYAIEACDTLHDEMMAWAFVVEHSKYLEVEEFFVRPAFRGRGHGRRMLQAVAALSAQRHRPLKFSVTFADIDDKNRTIFAQMLRMIGYKLVKGHARWAPFEGVPGRPKEVFTVPRKPAHIPSRPAAPPPSFASAGTVAASFLGSAVLMAEAASVAEQAQLSINGPLPSVYVREASELPSVVVGDLPTVQLASNDLAPAAKTDSSENAQQPVGKSMVIGSAEYDKKNERRMELIQKKVRGALTAREEAEFEKLQSEILEITKRAFPHPPVDFERWLRSTEGAREKSDTPD